MEDAYSERPGSCGNSPRRKATVECYPTQVIAKSRLQGQFGQVVTVRNLFYKQRLWLVYLGGTALKTLSDAALPI